MDNKEYYYYSLLNLLEDKLPPELFTEVKKYLITQEIKNEQGSTQIERVLNHLMEHGSITNMQCHLLYGIRHCPSVIRSVKKKLREAGSKYYIDTEPKKGCDRYGHKTNWVSYVLKEVENVMAVA